MLLQPEFYEASAQIIPVLLLKPAVRCRFLRRVSTTLA